MSLPRKIASVPFIVCASADYLKRAGRPSSPDDLLQHACLAFRYPLDGRFLRWSFIKDGHQYDAAINATTISNDVDALAQMAINGAGITRLAEFVAAPYIESGHLVPLFEYDSRSSYPYAEPLDIYACVQERAAFTPKVKALMDYLVEQLENRWSSENSYNA